MHSSVVFLIAFLFFTYSVFSDVIIFPSDDTYTFWAEPNSNFGTFPQLNLSYVHKTSNFKYEAFLKFQTNAMKKYLVKNMTLNWLTIKQSPTEKLCLGGSSCFRAMFYTMNQTWNENQIFFNDQPNRFTDIFFIGSIGWANESKWSSSSDLLLNSTFIPSIKKTYYNISKFLNEIYRKENISFFVNMTDYTSNALNGSVYSKETSFKPFLNVTTANYMEGYSENTDIDFLEFDFESGKSFPNIFIDWHDFDYQASMNAIMPNGFLNVSIAPALLSTTQDNDLSSKIHQCFTTKSEFFSKNKTYYPNGIPNTFSYYCLNVSESFFGMIKVINNTNVRGNEKPEFDFFWAVANEKYDIFSVPTYIPNPPRMNMNLTIFWTTTIPITTKIYFRYNKTGAWSPWQSIP